MRTKIGKIGLAGLILYGVFAIFQPEYMPKAEAPYDKLLHFGLFALATLFAVISTNDYRIALTLAGVILCGGILIEIIQTLLLGRSADMMDAAANGLGAAAVLGAYFFLRRGDSETPEDTIRQQVLDIYQRERDSGQNQAKSLEAAAEIYRLARPGLEEHEVRLSVVKIIEDSSVR